MSHNFDDARRRLRRDDETELLAAHLHAEAEQNTVLPDPESAVEQMFRSAPFIEAPHGLAERIMAAIAAGDAALSGRRRPRRRFRLPWFFLILILVVPLTLIGATLMIRSAAFGLLLGRAVNWLNETAYSIVVMLQGFAGVVSDPLVVLSLIAAAVAIAAAWAWMMVAVSAHGQRVEYRVPVRFH